VIIKTVFGHVFETDIIRRNALKVNAFSLITSVLLHITLQVQNCIKLKLLYLLTFFSVFATPSVTSVHLCIMIRKTIFPKDCVPCIVNR